MKALFAITLCVAPLFSSGCATSGVPPAASAGATEWGPAASSRCAAGWIARSKPIRCRVNAEPSVMNRSSGALLYISDIGAERVDVFSYPSGKRIGKLTGFREPSGLCSDAKGDVFVTDSYANEVLEFAHGGTKPIAKLEAGAYPTSCAVDPKTGNLAVTNWTAPGAHGYLEIFQNASGKPATVEALYRTFYCTYDGSGNLFVDGFASGGEAGFGEVAKGTTSFTLININGTIGWPGGMAWDGKQLVMGDQYASKFVPSNPPNALYQIKIASGQAEIAKTIPLNGGIDIVQAWLQGKTLIGPDASAGDAAFYKYPSGGNPTKFINGFDEPVGATVSK